MTLLNRYVAEGRIAGAVAGVARHGRVGYLQAVSTVPDYLRLAQMLRT